MNALKTAAAVSKPLPGVSAWPIPLPSPILIRSIEEEIEAKQEAQRARHREASQRYRARLKRPITSGPKPRYSAREAAIVAAMRRAKQPLPYQPTVPLRARRPNAKRVEVRRRLRDKGIRSNWCPASVEGVVKLHVTLMQKTIEGILRPHTLARCDIPSVWAWIDADNPAEAFSYPRALSHWCTANERDPIQVHRGIMRRRPAWLADCSLDPALYGLYVLYLLG